MLLMITDIPVELLGLIAFGFGVIIGSFLNVYIYRFHTGKSLSGSSHCLSCGTPLRPYDLFPLLSYLFLRGRCRACKAVIPPRYFLVELLTGLLFVATVLTTVDLIPLIYMLILVSILVVVAIYDINHMIIPNEFVWALLILVMLNQVYLHVVSLPLMTFVWNLLAATLGSLFLLSLWWISKGKWIGFGDVKLVFPLGLAVGYTGVFSMIVLSFWIGAVVGLLLLGFQALRKRGQPHLRFLPEELTIKSAVPFAPFLILGCLTVLFFRVDVVALLIFT